MQVELISNDGSVSVFKLSGKVTQQTLRKVEDPLESAGDDVYHQRVLFDMGKVDFVDSGGIGWLLKIHKRCRERGGRLILHSITPLVHNVMLVLRMNEVFDLAENSQEALSLPEKADAPPPKPEYKEVAVEEEADSGGEGDGE